LFFKTLQNPIEKDNDIQVIIDTPQPFLGGKWLNDRCKNCNPLINNYENNRLTRLQPVSCKREMVS